MEDKIPKSAPLNNISLQKPLELSHTPSYNGKNMINNNSLQTDKTKKNQDLSKNYSTKIVKKDLDLNLQYTNTGINVNIIVGVIPEKKSKKKKELDTQPTPRTSPYNFKYFCNTANKKSINQALSDKNKTEKKELESNFIKLSKEANMYTSNAEYITNKKLLLFNKYNFENNKYIPNRAKLFDMTSIPKIKTKINILYKTTKFRGGKMYFFDNKNPPKINDILESNNNKNYPNHKKPLYLRDLEKYETKKEQFFSNNGTQTKFIDNTFQKRKRYPPSNSLYRELMNKKNEIYDNFVNIITEGEEYYRPLINKQLFSAKYDEDENAKKKIKNEDLNGFTNLFSKKKNDGLIPITYPLVCAHMINHDSMSQRARYENIMESFIRLRSMIENDKAFGKFNEKKYIREFLSNKNIDKTYLNEKNYENFSNFLKLKKMPIDINKTLKENIIVALNYDEFENKILNSDDNDNNNDNLEKNESKKNNLNNKQIPSTKTRIISNESNIFKNKPLEFDIPRQKKLLDSGNYRNDIELRDSLQKELEIIENEVEDKQNKIKNIEDNLGLLPFESDYYYKQNLNKKNFNKEKKKDLRLISQKEYYKTTEEQKKNKKKINKNYNLYDFNERLYYTWYKNQNIGDIKHYKKQSKLTEYIIYNRTKEKIIDEKIEEIAEKKSLNLKNNNKK
jgi:hypothetical protein